MDNFIDTKVLIMGLGLHGGGLGAARFFAKHGARVTITDLRSEEDLKSSIAALKEFSINYHLGEHNEEDFKSHDLVIQNPAVPSTSPYLAVARRHDIPVETDLTVAIKMMNRSQVIGITGTKGKSTTASLIAHILQKGGANGGTCWQHSTLCF